MDRLGDSRKYYLIIGFVSPPIMFIGGLLFFIPRNPSFYSIGGSLDWTNVATASLTWIILAWITFLVAVKIDAPNANRQTKQNDTFSALSDNVAHEATGIGSRIENPRRPFWLRRIGPFYGWKGVMIFFAICFFIFGYFEVQYPGFFLYGPWELPRYILVLVPFFTLAYMGRRWIPSWRVYILLWIVWGIIWDTAVPGFVYVPNLFTWHQWMFSVAAARFVVDGNL
jgi:hypothetical protein